MTPARQTYTTSKVAQVVGTDRQTILGWDRRGILSPSRRVRGERRYNIRDLVAALIIPGVREMGLPPEAVNRIVELVQEADDRKLKLTGIVTYRSEHVGMMRHALIDVNDDEARKFVQKTRRRDKGKDPEEREIIDFATLSNLVRAVLKTVARRLEDQALQKLSRTAD